MKRITFILQKAGLLFMFKHIRYIIILVVVLCALPCFARPATGNRTLDWFYNLTPKEFDNLMNYYVQNNLTDSAILCANVQASKYDKEKLTTEEVKACCIAYRYIGMVYINDYYNYQIAAENLLKAEQIAHKHGFERLWFHITFDEAILTATKNDIESNFAYNKIVLDNFKKSFHFTLLKSDNTESHRQIIETTVSNLLCYAIKHDNTKEVTNEIQAYRQAQKVFGSESNIAELLCNAIECYNSGNYDKASEILQTPIIHTDYFTNRNYILMESMVSIAQYAVLLKSGKRTEALKLLLQQEQFLRENEMPFELLEVMQLLRQHYEAEGKEMLADKYALLYYTTKDEFIYKSRVGKMDQARLNLELEETRERIREMSYRQQMQTILLWSAIIITLLALGILAVLYVNYRKTKRTNRLLYEKNIALLNANKELLPTITEITKNPAKEVPTQADLELIERIIAVMESSPEVYEETFSRQRLAELAGSNYKAVSRAINTCKGSNFNVLLNEYRIKEACRRLMDVTTYGSYTIEAIANSIGYKSRSNFATVFKEIVGLTPSAFQKMHQQDQSNTPHYGGDMLDIALESDNAC